MLEADPELAADVAPDERQRAEAASRAPVRALTRGEWEFVDPPDRTALGALMLEGMVVLRVELRGSSHLEVLGPGDLINPWLLGTETPLVEETSVHVVESGRVAVLDASFTARMNPWPEVFAALMRRAIMRVRRMIVQAAILSRPRAEHRLELMLWRLAEQFGSVTADGLEVRLPLTHEQLSEMIAARQSTVTLAIGALVADDRLRHPSRNVWILPHREVGRLTGSNDRSG